jgi:DNA-binding transcriptional ArsR family regulator
MDAEPDLSRLARTIGDPTRIRMLTLLMEGRALTAKELAHGTGVTPATATAHLRKLLDDALVAAVSQGRHKYFRFASPAVPQAVEALLAIAPQTTQATAAAPLPAIQRARFCYDHLAGRIATRLLDALLRRKWLRLAGRNFTVTPRGHAKLTALGLDLATAADTRRRFACACLDWSERRDHLGGALGAALADHALAAGWIKRQPGSRIAVVTRRGHDAWHAHFGIAAE